MSYRSQTFGRAAIIGGIIAGSSFFVEMLAVFQPNVIPGVDTTQDFLLELIIVWIAGIIAGMGLAFGRYSGRENDIIGGIAFAAIFGFAGWFVITDTPGNAAIVSIVAALMALIGLFVAILTTQAEGKKLGF
ncbi:MAG: hypothetical protein ACFFCQ_13755 [Promethearchaeota archaeon]